MGRHWRAAPFWSLPPTSDNICVAISLNAHDKGELKVIFQFTVIKTSLRAYESLTVSCVMDGRNMHIYHYGRCRKKKLCGVGQFSNDTCQLSKDYNLVMFGLTHKERKKVIDSMSKTVKPRKSNLVCILINLDIFLEF